MLILDFSKKSKQTNQFLIFTSIFTYNYDIIRIMQTIELLIKMFRSFVHQIVNIREFFINLYFTTSPIWLCFIRLFKIKIWFYNRQCVIAKNLKQAKIIIKKNPKFDQLYY